MMRRTTPLSSVWILFSCGVLLSSCGRQALPSLHEPKATPATFLNVATAANSCSIGVTIEQRGGEYIIVSVVPGSGAAQSNVHPGSVLLSVAGYSTHNLSLEQVRKLLQGPARTLVNIVVRLPAHRGGITVDIPVPRTAS